MKPLHLIDYNKPFFIREIHGNNEFKIPLIQKGLCIGAEVKLVERKDECFIISINNSMRYVINFAIANKVWVDEK